ncbi:diguanylate cyclase domain-containing protein [Pseudidiomarina sp. CB1]|uniref:diguanylate cyclase domain-containing protein n=1 Tax=Pseudidiomarina sp. CB1 TaxID=2972484 RepID=UPI00216295CC|nr:diguanylate cyclase [Pseudidiomarina sp. CB1]
MDIITIIVLTGLTNLTFALYSWQQVSNPESHFACRAFALAQFIKAVSFILYAISLYHGYDHLRLIANLLIFIGCWAEVRSYNQLASAGIKASFLWAGTLVTCGVFTWFHFTSGDGPNNTMIVTSSVLLVLPFSASVYALYRLLKQHPSSVFPRVLLIVNAMIGLFCLIRAPLAASDSAFIMTQPVIVNQAFIFATFLLGLGNGIGFIGFLKERSDERLRVRANIDYLTGIYNRHYFEQLAEARIQTGEDFTLYFLDIDKFKAVNDRYGHATGDEVLRLFGKLLRDQQERHNGLVGRLGGEEFGILLSGSDSASHASTIQQLRQDFAELTKNKLGYSMSFSLGACSSREASSLQDLMHNADTLLYDAKHQLSSS